MSTGKNKEEKKKPPSLARKKKQLTAEGWKRRLLAYYTELWSQLYQ